MLKRFLLLIILIFGFVLLQSPSFAIGDNGFSWDKKTLSVYIPDGHAYAGMMSRAFKRWQDKSFGQLKFNFVKAKPADIEVDFPAKTDGTDVGDLGSYSLLIKGGAIVKATIEIVPDSKKYSKDMIFTVMIHEVGHALGLTDTKRNLGIMHTPVSDKQDIVSNDIIRLFRLNGWSYMNKGTYSTF